jgi:cell division septal protein FtsQ
MPKKSRSMLPMWLKRKKTYRPPSSRVRFQERLVILLGRALVGLVALALLSLCGFFAWALHGFLFESEYFEIDDVSITIEEASRRAILPRGAGTWAEANDSELSRLPEEILGLLREVDMDGGNLPRLDTEAVRLVVESHGKVKSATVEKQYPTSVHISVRIRHIAALLLQDPILAVDAEGVVTQSLTTRSPLAGQFPYITGLELGRPVPGERVSSESLTKALQLLSSLQVGAPGLARKISEAHCGTDGELTLIFRGGAEVRFGTGDWIRKMAAFETFLRRDPQQPEKSAYIDLRVEGQVSSMTKEEASARRATDTLLSPEQ